MGQNSLVNPCLTGPLQHGVEPSWEHTEARIKRLKMSENKEGHYNNLTYNYNLIFIIKIGLKRQQQLPQKRITPTRSVLLAHS